MDTTPRRLKAFAGIGSRSTPPAMLDLLQRACHWLVLQGWTCRSGGAQGADTACQTGAIQGLSDHVVAASDTPWGGLEVYLPWPTFGRGLDWYDAVANHPEADLPLVAFARPTDQAVALAGRFHPAWGACSSAAQLLHGRNSHQVLGYDLRQPSSFLLCWTPDGADGSPDFPVTRDTGGTGQAIRLAVAHAIPVLNVRRTAHYDRVRAQIG